MMQWYYTRAEETLTLDVRYDQAAREYVATTIGLDPETTRFRSGGRLRAWLRVFDREMSAASWKPEGPPHILPLAWRRRRRAPNQRSLPAEAS